MRTIPTTLIIILAAVCAAQAQTYNSASGGYNTGYGTVYGSFGLAMATQNLYNTTQMSMQKAMARQMMINKWGRAAVEKAEREAAGSSSGSGRSSSSSAAAGPVVPKRVVTNYGKFRPDRTVDTAKALADALGADAGERALIRQIYDTTKKGFEAEAAAKGYSNNIAGGLTFFAVAAMTVYHDGPEPSDEAVQVLYDALNMTIDEIPEFGKMPNKDKQAFYNTMIGFGGLLLAGYTEGKQNGDQATLDAYSKLAGSLIEMVLKIPPDKLRYAGGQIVIDR